MDSVVIAARILGQRYDRPIRLADPAQLRSSFRSRVYRCAVGTVGDGLPCAVIIKQATQPYGTMVGGALDGSVWQEYAALQLLEAVAAETRVAPECYGGDVQAGLLVMEDLGDRPSLRDLLAGEDGERAEEALVSSFAALGRLHALARRQADRYHALRSALGAYDPEADWFRRRIEQTPQLLRTMAAQVGVPVSAGAEHDLAILVATLRDPGEFGTLIHGDPTPSNVFLIDSTPVLIDFEYAGVAHALIEGAQARIPFPTGPFVGRIPEPIVRRAEAAYRVELARGVRAAEADRPYGQALAAASAYWAISFLAWLPFAELLREDRHWGNATVRQRVLHFLTAAGEASAAYGEIEALGTTLRLIAERLRRLWPEVRELPAYPAFRGAG